jgi:DnaA family protein
VVNEQLTLRFGWQDGFSLSNYFPASNQPAVHFLRAIDFSSTGNTATDHFAYLWGSAGAGKSHLLQAACQQVSDAGHSVAYLPLGNFDELHQEMFGGLEQLSLICIDDVQLVAGNSQWEEALFHLYNRVHEAKKTLLVTGNVAPSALPIKLPDLLSRLTWGPVFYLQELNDEEKVEALRLRAEGRGFVLPNDVAQFLIKRSPRDMESLFGLLDRLDEASLSQHRKLTIPFVRDLI